MNFDDKNRESIKEAVHRALQNKEFVPYYQPQYNYAKQKISGVEVLSRWNNPEKGILTPAAFIPVLEEEGGIEELDYQIFEAAAKEIRQWLDEGLILPSFSLNLSRYTLMDPDHKQKIMDIIKEYRLNPGMIHLEVTESAYVEDHESIYHAISDLRGQDFQLEMDDFGSGYSSLSFLKDAPVDVLKLDMAFLQLDHNQEKGGSIISSMITLAGNLDMKLIAEGVETYEQAEYLKSLGCFNMQGYYFAKPMSGEDFKILLMEGNISPEGNKHIKKIHNSIDFLDDSTQSALIFNSFVGGAFIMEYAGDRCTIIRTNDRLEKEMWLGPDDLEDHEIKHLEIFDEVNRKLLKTKFEEAISTEDEVDFEIKSTREYKGMPVWAYVRARCIAVKGNTYIFYINLTNISQRKNLDRQIRKLSNELENAEAVYHTSLASVTELYHRIINETDTAIVVTDLEDHNILYANESAAKLGDTTVENAIGKKCYECLNKCISVSHKCTDAIPDEGVSMDEEREGRFYRIRRKKTDWNGKEASVCYIEDRTEAELANLKAKEIVRNFPDGISVLKLHPDGRIERTYINRKSATVLGYNSPADALGFITKDSIFVHPEDIDGLLQIETEAKKEKSGFETEFRVSKGGVITWIAMSAVFYRDEYSEDDLFLCVYRDITREKNDAAELKISEGEYRAALIMNSKMICRYILTDRALVIPKDMAEKFNSLTYMEDAPKGFIKNGYITEESKNDWLGFFDAIDRGEKEGRAYELGIARLDGGFRWYNASFSATKLENGDTIAAILTFEDVTQAREDRLKAEGRKKEDNTQSQWKNIVQIISEKKGELTSLLTDDEMRIRIQYFAIYTILGVVSLGMTVLNRFTGWHKLGVITLVFGIMYLINMVLCLINEKLALFARYASTIEMLALFAAFAIFGEPEGFAVLWSVLLPTCGLLLFRMKYGTILVVIQWLIYVVLFWTPFGNSLLQYEYTETFKQRYPILFMALFFVGFFFEYVRFNTQKELINTREKYEYMYNRDALTGLYNRYGFNSTVTEMLQKHDKKNVAFCIMDLDDFKAINDTYGHLNGDIVLKETAQIIQGVVGDMGTVSRWGGEEFSVLFYDAIYADSLCNRILKNCRAKEYIFNGKVVKPTLSIGLVIVDNYSEQSMSEIITKADEFLYEAKNTGKDKMVSGGVSLHHDEVTQ